MWVFVKDVSKHLFPKMSNYGDSHKCIQNILKDQNIGGCITSNHLQHMNKICAWEHTCVVVLHLYGVIHVIQYHTAFDCFNWLLH